MGDKLIIDGPVLNAQIRIWFRVMCNIVNTELLFQIVGLVFTVLQRVIFPLGFTKFWYV